ncbi:MAG: YdcF family protein [Cyanobacteria bacterium J06635_15]
MRSRQVKAARKSKSKRLRLCQLAIAALALWWGQGQILSYFDQPEVVLVLGGATEREKFAAQFAKAHPEVDIWVSSGANPEYAEMVFAQANIDRDRVRLDYEAVDTVTNFTTLVADLKRQNVDCIYLMTSDYHMRRAKIIGQIVLGSQGIRFKPIPVPTDRESENWVKGIRDGLRSVVWVLTGHTGSRWGQTLGKS